MRGLKDRADCGPVVLRLVLKEKPYLVGIVGYFAATGDRVCDHLSGIVEHLQIIGGEAFLVGDSCEQKGQL